MSVARLAWGVLGLALCVAIGWRVSESKKKQATLEAAVAAKMAKLAATEDVTPTSAVPPAAAAKSAEVPAPTIRRSDVVYFSGELRPIAEAELSFAVSGRLARILVSQGDWVKENQALLMLEDREAQAHLKQARAAVEAAKAQASMAADAQKRVESLGTSTALSEQQRFTVGDQARLAHAGLMQAEASLELAELNVHNQTLRAPFAGRITRVPNGIGQIYMASMPVVGLVDSSRWKILASISLDDGGRVQKGDVVELSSTGLKDAVVRHVSPVLQERSRRVQIEMSASPSEGAALFAGQVVSGSIKAKK